MNETNLFVRKLVSWQWISIATAMKSVDLGVGQVRVVVFILQPTIWALRPCCAAAQT